MLDPVFLARKEVCDELAVGALVIAFRVERVVLLVGHGEYLSVLGLCCADFS